MKKAVTLLLTLTIVLTSLASFAEADGGVDSGGGGALNCNGQTELLDLWEGEAIYDLNIVRSNENAIEQFARAAGKLAQIDSALPAEVTAIAQKLFNEKLSLKAGMELEPPRDANSNYKKKNCSLVGMMFYDRLKQKLVIDESHFSKLKSNTDVAAGMMHEAWYYLVRKNQSKTVSVKDSVNSRKLVACLFSDSSTCLLSERLKLQRSPFYTCKSETSEIEIGNDFGKYYYRIKKLQGRTFTDVVALKTPANRHNVINLGDHEAYKNSPLAGFDLQKHTAMPVISFDSSLATMTIHKENDQFANVDFLDCEDLP